jgi:hypothetical protein
MSPSKTQFSACTPIKPVIIRYFGGLLFQIQTLRDGVSSFHIIGPTNVNYKKSHNFKNNPVNFASLGM